jgi:hypothetical protein
MNKQKKIYFEETTEIVGWIQIFLSPFIISLILAGVIYIAFDSVFSLIISATILIIGIFAGIKIAKKIFRSKNGAVHFVSRVSASPELDEKNKDINK